MRLNTSFGISPIHVPPPQPHQSQFKFIMKQTQQARMFRCAVQSRIKKVPWIDSSCILARENRKTPFVVEKLTSILRSPQPHPYPHQSDMKVLHPFPYPSLIEHPQTWNPRHLSSIFQERQWHVRSLQRPHSLLQPTPINQRPRLQDLQSGTKALLLLLHIYHRRLSPHNSIDGTDRWRGVGGIWVSVTGHHWAVRCWGGATEWGAEAGEGEGLEACGAHIDWCWWRCDGWGVMM